VYSIPTSSEETTSGYMKTNIPEQDMEILKRYHQKPGTVCPAT